MGRVMVALVLATALNAEARPTGVVEGQITVMETGLLGALSEKKSRANVVVELDIPLARPVQMQWTMDQLHREFRPSFLAIYKGARVTFPNMDHEQHSVFSLSPTRPFDLRLFSSGTSDSVKFDRAGLVEVFCSIHPDMEAIIRILDRPWFVVTDGDGRFRLPDVPVGTWRVTIWPRHGDAVPTAVVVAEGKSAFIKATVIESRTPGFHLNRDGRPYSRYP